MKEQCLSLAVLLCATTQLMAQQATTKGYPYQRTEVSVGIGFSSDASNTAFDYPSSSLIRSTPLENYHAGKFYLTNETSGPVFSIDVHHHFSKHWTIGLQGAYRQVKRERFRLLTDEKDGQFMLHDLSLMASVRYYYGIHAKYAFYSGLSIGVNRQLHRSYDQTRYTGVSDVTGQTTLFGFMFGTDLYGYGELGSNRLGLVRAGIGYRF